ncbi:MAG: hypothetical protein ABSB73_06115, partial [Solirubrobacteraceae bacterium]
MGVPPARLAAPADRSNGGQPGPIRVALADDRALVRHGLRLLLGGEEDIELLSGTADVASLGGQVAA